MSVLNLFAQTYNSETSGAGGVLWILIALAVAVVMIAAMWKMYTKAGKPGWAAIVPIYNAYVMLKMAGRPGWWLLLYLVPFVNIVVQILVSLDIAKAFGKSAAFGIFGLFFFTPVGTLILGYGDAKYKGVPKH